MAWGAPHRSSLPSCSVWVGFLSQAADLRGRPCLSLVFTMDETWTLESETHCNSQSLWLPLGDAQIYKAFPEHQGLLDSNQTGLISPPSSGFYDPSLPEMTKFLIVHQKVKIWKRRFNFTGHKVICPLLALLLLVYYGRKLLSSPTIVCHWIETVLSCMFLLLPATFLLTLALLVSHSLLYLRDPLSQGSQLPGKWKRSACCQGWRCIPSEWWDLWGREGQRKKEGQMLPFLSSTWNNCRVLCFFPWLPEFYIQRYSVFILNTVKI